VDTSQLGHSYRTEKSVSYGEESAQYVHFKITRHYGELIFHHLKYVLYVAFYVGTVSGECSFSDQQLHKKQNVTIYFKSMSFMTAMMEEDRIITHMMTLKRPKLLKQGSEKQRVN
jgi:hypothetical protein